MGLFSLLAASEVSWRMGFSPGAGCWVSKPTWEPMQREMGRDSKVETLSILLIIK